jgi:hypothetical protein
MNDSLKAPIRSPVNAKGIYLTGQSLKTESFQTIISKIKQTNINTVVIDIKDDFGKISYNSNVPLVNILKSDEKPSIADINALLMSLKRNHVYSIARIVTFKDPYLSRHKPELAIHTREGKAWRDSSDISWIDPYKRETWDYTLSIAQEIASLGFNEIQFDYVRFPDNAKSMEREVAFDNPNNISKSKNIASFLQYARNELKSYPVFISADVFGLVTSSSDDMGIGQIWEEISPNVDYISPMTYASHYSSGVYGIKNPEEHPYDVLKFAMKDALKRNEVLKEKGMKPAIIRPWIQDFDYKHDYNEKDTKNQIKALHELGINEYLSWNAQNEYTYSAYR